MRYQVRKHQFGFKIWDLHQGEWVFGSWTAHQAKAQAMCQRMNDAAPKAPKAQSLKESVK